MYGEIIEILERIVSENDITIIYACESGSRAWGFDNVESDWDVRFIYKRNNPQDYLTLSEFPEVIELMDDKFDIVGWDIKKALNLHYSNNPTLREWLISPIKYIGFKEDVFKDLPDFDRATLKYHYTNIAKNNWKKLSQDDLDLTKRVIKMFMYNCRCVLTWIVLDEGENPSINIFDLLKQVNDLDDDIFEDICSLIGYYRNNCQDELDLEIIYNIKQWMGSNLEIMRHDFPKKDNSKNLEIYNQRFFDVIFPEYDKYIMWLDNIQ